MPAAWRHVARGKPVKKTAAAGRSARKTAKVVSYAEIPESDSEDDVDSDDAADNDAEAELVMAKVEPLAPVFKTFSVDDTLEDGLSILRGLGDGKYEIINLGRVHAGQMGSEETGRLFSGIPGRIQMVDIDEEAWKEAELKCGQALKSAKGNIFRFVKLPIELRYRIYDFTVMGRGRLNPAHEPDKRLGLALMKTCRQIRKEALPFFYRNNFNVEDLNKHKELKDNWPKLSKNLQEVTFNWWGWSNKDPATLAKIAQCPNLKVFNLVLTQYCVSRTGINQRRQYLYQDEPSIKNFSQTNGFDALTNLRGLERVTVRNHVGSLSAFGILDSQITAFETFLNRIMTQPRERKTQLSKKDRAALAKEVSELGK